MLQPSVLRQVAASSNLHVATSGGNMVGEIEELGGLTTAGLVASVIDGSAGKAGEVQVNCANCDTPLRSHFCENCGQSAHMHRTVGHLVEEFTHGLLHIDTKTWRTLPKLIFQPGTLTREYVHGKRARYITPLAMFLFTMFLMFFVFGFIADSIDPNKAMIFDGPPVNVAVAQDRLKEAKADLKTAQAKLASAEADAKALPNLVGIFAGQVAAHQARVAVAGNILKRAEAAPAKIRRAPEKTTWQRQVQDFAHSDDLAFRLGSPKIDARIRHTLENPDLALYKIEQKAYKLSFLLVPLSLPFIWLLFPFRRGVNMYDHTVFALYSLSFMSLLVVTIALMSQGPKVVQDNMGWLLLAVPVHMLVQLKGAYSLGWKSAVWRTLWLMLFSGLALSIFLLTILLLGLID